MSRLGPGPGFETKPKMAKLLKTRLISPYQHDGVKWLVNRENALDYPGGFLCDEMGLGKTVQMLATMCVNIHIKKTLIVVPKSLVSQWRDEIHKFTSFSVCLFDGPARVLEEADIVVAPYSVLAPRNGNPVTPLHQVRWGRVVLDEGHEIRNRKSKTHIAARALQAGVRWIVSGTPVMNAMRDFVALCGFLGIDSRNVQAQPGDYRAKYVLRRTKADVAAFNKRLELPPCDFQNIELDMYPEEQELYEEVYDRARGMVNSILQSENSGMFQMQILEALLRTRQVMIWPQLYNDGIAAQEEKVPELWTGRSRKLERLLELIASHPKERALVFCNFMGEMDEIEKRLYNQGVPTWRIDGSVEKGQREARLRDFKTGPENAVFLIQIKAGGVGLNLQEATRVYITSPSWNPATELQAIGRVHRQGQTSKVVVRRLIYVGRDGAEPLPSVEQSIMDMQAGKAAITAELLNDPRLLEQVPNMTKTKLNIYAVKKIFSL